MESTAYVGGGVIFVIYRSLRDMETFIQDTSFVPNKLGSREFKPWKSLSWPAIYAAMYN